MSDTIAVRADLAESEFDIPAGLDPAEFKETVRTIQAKPADLIPLPDETDNEDPWLSPGVTSTMADIESVPAPPPEQQEMEPPSAPLPDGPVLFAALPSLGEMAMGGLPVLLTGEQARAWVSGEITAAVDRGDLEALDQPLRQIQAMASRGLPAQDVAELHRLLTWYQQLQEDPDAAEPPLVNVEPTPLPEKPAFPALEVPLGDPHIAVVPAAVQQILRAALLEYSSTIRSYADRAADALVADQAAILPARTDEITGLLGNLQRDTLSAIAEVRRPRSAIGSSASRRNELHGLTRAVHDAAVMGAHYPERLTNRVRRLALTGAATMCVLGLAIGCWAGFQVGAAGRTAEWLLPMLIGNQRNLAECWRRAEATGQPATCSVIVPVP